MILDKISSAKNLNELKQIIRSYFSDYEDTQYIPAIFKEGYFTYNRLNQSKNKDSRDFYSKMIVRPKNHILSKTWNIMNFSNAFIDLNQMVDTNTLNLDLFIYNIIVTRKLFGKEVYAYNPVLFDDESNIDEENYKNDSVVNNIYDDGYTRSSVLKVENENIMIFRKALENFNKTGISSNYIVSIEFEYRNTTNHFEKSSNFLKTDDSIITLEYYDSNKNSPIWVTGTIDIEIEIEKNDNLEIITNKISGGRRELNESNYSDDIDAGLIAFDYDSIALLQKRHLILGLHMLDVNNQKSYLIDTFADKIVFWESEFNKLPYQTKKELQSHNISNDLTNLISEAMFKWQLEGDLEFRNHMSPFQMLGDHLLSEYRNLVLEYQCNVVLPNTIEIFREQANVVLEICKVSIDELFEMDNFPMINKSGFKTIENIINGTIKDSLDENLNNLFQMFCLCVLGKENKDYVESFFRKLK